MTLYETTKLIENIAAQQPAVTNIIWSGDIFDLNKDEFAQKYSAVCITQRNHTLEDDFITFNFTVYYVDRLTESDDNKLDVQSTAVTVLTNITNTLRQIVPDISLGDITTFTERFTALCAGAWINVGITVPTDYCADPNYTISA